jgi:hypothetical protein
MDRLKKVKESIIECIEVQIEHNLDNVNTKELGEAIDMVKDLSEAIYYCTVTEAMHAPQHYDSETKSAYCRKTYMEGKTHNDKLKQMQELENYVMELGKDITEMIQDASQEEKQMLQQKIQMLAAKIK